MKTTISLLVFILLFHAFSWAQSSKDTKAKVEEKVVSSLKDFESQSSINRPTKAALLSAVLPGLGQVYNKKYWKLPIVYGGAVAFGAVIRFNQNQYTEFKNELIRQTDNDPSTVPISSFSQTSLRSIRDNARRNRDYSIILSILFYGLNIADAAVDAHLKDFDIDDDLSMQVLPTLLPTPEGKPIPGLALSVQF
ncbi:MAG: DUF5683 domain-containing protein [Flammeovirgaceae bacterium]